MKKCTTCKEVLEETEFYKDKSRYDGLDCHCKKCNSIKHKKYVEKNKEKVKLNDKKSYEKNKEKRLKYAKDNYSRTKEVRALRKKEIDEYRKKWREENREKCNEQAKLWQRDKKKKDAQYRLNCVFSNRITQSLKIFNIFKSKCGWQKAVGYTLKDLVEHLEKQFDENMSWDNYGSYWHIDHIKPKSLFVFESIEDEQFKECWGLNNLRPLEAKENIRKSNKYQPPVAESE
jgi:hypothetical protein